MKNPVKLIQQFSPETVTMTTSNEELPIIDWTQEGQLTNDSINFTHELLVMFSNELPETQVKLNRAYDQQNLTALREILHKLQGACVYCGLLRLKSVIIETNKTIRQTKSLPTPDLFNKLNQELTAVARELKEKGIVVK